ncbi:HAAS signaling domain-containing protein [Micromonosporaceae bacterium Da 78-11]
MNTKQNDVVAEYLHEVDLRLSGLPVLQRRELLADLAAHVATERTERNIRTEGELIEILERLGAPDVVAAAAYQEAGSYPPPPPTTVRAKRPGWLLPAGIGAAVLIVLVLVLCGFSFFFQTSSSRPSPAEPARMPATVEPVQPR